MMEDPVDKPPTSVHNGFSKTADKGGAFSPTRRTQVTLVKAARFVKKPSGFRYFFIFNISTINKPKVSTIIRIS